MTSRKCPQCGRQYGDDYSFCLDDGTLLSAAEGHSTGDRPTQVLPVRRAATRPSRSWALPSAVGLLAVAIVGLAAVLLLRRGDGDKIRFEKAGIQAPRNEPVSNANAATANIPAANSTANSSPSTPAVSPSGKWFGNWSTGTGAYYKFDLTLTESGGRVDGQANWKMLRTTRPDKQDKIGLTAIEYVSGRYDPMTRAVTMSGYRKDDPNNMLVMLDQYRLNLSPDGRTLNGAARNGGKWNGKVELSR